MHAPLRTVFMGTPDFAAVILRQLAATACCELAAVYCRPDKPAGRGHKLTPPPVKVAAEDLGLPVCQPANFRQDAERTELAAWQPDVLVVAAYGLILPQAVLDIPQIGAYNVHASLLPLYRGAAPIQRAIMDGRSVTGITIMCMEAGLDTGPMLLQRALGIGEADTAATLHNELADLGARLMIEVLDAIRTGQPPAPIPQNDALSTYAARLEKKDGLIDWNRPAHAVQAHMRGVTPWPGAQSVLHLPGRAPLPVLLTPGPVGTVLPCPMDPGTIGGLVDGQLAVACADAFCLIPALRLSGKKTMPAGAFWNGYVHGTDPAVPGFLRPPDTV